MSWAFFVDIGNLAARSRELGRWANAMEDLGAASSELRAHPGQIAKRVAATMAKLDKCTASYRETIEPVTSAAVRQPTLSAADIAGFEVQMSDAQGEAVALL